MLPAETYDDIPLDKRPTTLVRSVVRPRNLASKESPKCISATDNFHFLTRSGNELVGIHEVMPSLPSDSLNSPVVHSEEPSVGIPTGNPNLPPAPTIIDFESIPLSQTKDSPESYDTLASQHSLVVETEPLCSEEPHTPTDISASIPIVSQIQDDDTSINDLDHIAVDINADDHATITSQVNNVLDDTDDYQRAELTAIISHRIASGVLELAVRYSDGIYSWHPIDLCITEDAQAVANYVLQNDIGKTYNDCYGHWDRKFYVP